MKLVLIEGPGKKAPIEKYLGKGYKVVPTFGHVRDLPVKKLGVNIEKDFKPEYVVMPDKKKVVDKLKQEAEKAETVLFATDPDREGEAIAWHLSQILKIDPATNCRISFNEITEETVQNGLKHPRAIDFDLVDAQQARRVLDRLVGYKLSPILCKKIQSKLSAGRVQSVTLRLIVDRDSEIENFKPEEYWNLNAFLFKTKESEVFKAALSLPKNKKISSKEEADKIVDDLTKSVFVVKKAKKALSKSHAPAPFTTSTMQQDALNKLGFSLKQTSATAQVLYEGVDVVGEGKVPLVTYIRTDSVRVSPKAQAQAKEFINENYGAKYVPNTTNIYKSKKDAQDAHEAIRPISLTRTPESLKDKVQKNVYRLYKLIYDRFLASQMAEATYDSLTVEIEASKYIFKCQGKAPIFDGYTIVYQSAPAGDEKEPEFSKLPTLDEGDVLKLQKLAPEQKYTKPPARFTEASLVKAMEDKGIGRPATYTQTVTVLFSREYIEKEGKQLISTKLGRVVVELLEKFFSDIMDIGFTALMETRLDEIEEGGKEWQKIVGDFYVGFEKELKVALGDSYKNKLPDEESDVICDKCGAKMVIKNGKYGKFLACPNYPTCKNTKQMNEVACKCPKCGGDVLKRRTKTGKIFFGCSNYPKCDFSTWDTPVSKPCPKCGGLVTMKSFGSKKVYSCIACDFKKEVDSKVPKKQDDNEEQE